MVGWMCQKNACLDALNASVNRTAATQVFFYREPDMVKRAKDGRAMDLERGERLAKKRGQLVRAQEGRLLHASAEPLEVVLSQRRGRASSVLARRDRSSFPV